MKPQSKQQNSKVTKNVAKAINYTVIAVLAGSILFMFFKVSKIVIHVYDIGDKKEIGLYFVWCIILAVILYHNL
jgi:hypothetical protein